MTGRKFTDWEKDLREAHSQLSAELEKARLEFEEKTKEIREELARTEAMLKALAGQVSAKKKARRSTRPNGFESNYSNAEIIPVIESLLRERGALAEKEIFAHVKAKAGEARKSAQGLHFRMKAALKDGRFISKEDKWALV